jgi:hypothetical protein
MMDPLQLTMSLGNQKQANKDCISFSTCNAARKHAGFMEERQKRNDGGAKSKPSGRANYLRYANRKTGQWQKKHEILREFSYCVCACQKALSLPTIRWYHNLKWRKRRTYMKSLGSKG